MVPLVSVFGASLCRSFSFLWASVFVAWGHRRSFSWFPMPQIRALLFCASALFVSSRGLSVGVFVAFFCSASSCRVTWVFRELSLWPPVCVEGGQRRPLLCPHSSWIHSLPGSTHRYVSRIHSSIVLFCWRPSLRGASDRHVSRVLWSHRQHITMLSHTSLRVMSTC